MHSSRNSMLLKQQINGIFFWLLLCFDSVCPIWPPVVLMCSIPKFYLIKWFATWILKTYIMEKYSDVIIRSSIRSFPLLTAVAQVLHFIKYWSVPEIETDKVVSYLAALWETNLSK